jgi:hypothetical protein
MSRPVPDESLSPVEDAAVKLAARLRTEGLEPLLELQLSDGDARVARAALQILSDAGDDRLVDLALEAARRVSH